MKTVKALKTKTASRDICFVGFGESRELSEYQLV